MYDNEKKVSMWIKESKKGSKFMAGTVQINGKKYDIVLFKNFNKKSENSPDYTGEIKDKETYIKNEVQNKRADNNDWVDDNYGGKDKDIPF